jgi:protoporphyrinogen oxidase
MIVILGAGLAGLSAGYHLGKREHILLEREDRVGGLCRSVEVDGFTFDLTGHLLHLRDEKIRALVDRLLPADSWHTLERRSWIYSHGVYTPYPFQANTHGLPAEVVRDCLIGFVHALLEADAGEDLSGLSFKEWIRRTFGEGIARHFMEPFNEKLWRSDLTDMTCEWVSWSIPRPRLEDVVNGALGLAIPPLGYNAQFRYPRRGGIQTLPDALVPHAGTIRTGADVKRLDTRRRVVHLADGTALGYEAVISTLPLDRLLQITDGLPEAVRDSAGVLRAVSVINLNLGIERPNLSDRHWIYFPEPEYPFYRVGFPACFAPASVPEGCSSVYVEISASPGGMVEERDVYAAAVAGLQRAGILRPDDKIVARRMFVIHPAYVVYDRYRRVALPAIFRALEEERIFSIGRFGGWEYSSMEDALRHGMQVVERLGDVR